MEADFGERMKAFTARRLLIYSALLPVAQKFEPGQDKSPVGIGRTQREFSVEPESGANKSSLRAANSF
jgi:hypothetical protein